MNDILLNEDTKGCATITLNRPKTHNAFDDSMVSSLQAHLERINSNRDIRVVVLAAKGKSFSSGADLNWMRQMAKYSQERNYKDALAMADFFSTLANLRQPTLALIQGPAFGGGVGLVAACDIAIASNRAFFGLSEVKLGLAPAVISPYLYRAMGTRTAQRFFLTGETFDAAMAERVGLVHCVVPPQDLQTRAEKFISLLLQNGPEAMATIKHKLAPEAVISQDMTAKYTAKVIAELRSSLEGKEGISAFLEKRQPKWSKRDV